MRQGRRHRERKPGRRSPFRDPKLRILIVCEGEVTEKQYLRGFERTRRALIFKSRSLTNMVFQGLSWRSQSAEEGRRAEGEKRTGQLSDFDAVWCVFDVDEHPNVSEAKTMARDNGVELAISNSCFELWLLLHFRESPRMQDRQRIQSMLKKHVPKYDKRIEFEVFRPHCETAMKRAAQMDQLAEDVTDPGRNPTTGVYKLLKRIADDNS